MSELQGFHFAKHGIQNMIRTPIILSQASTMWHEWRKLKLHETPLKLHCPWSKNIQGGMCKLWLPCAFSTLQFSRTKSTFGKVTTSLSNMFMVLAWQNRDVMSIRYDICFSSQYIFTEEMQLSTLTNPSTSTKCPAFWENCDWVLGKASEPMERHLISLLMASTCTCFLIVTSVNSLVYDMLSEKELKKFVAQVSDLHMENRSRLFRPYLALVFFRGQSKVCVRCWFWVSVASKVLMEFELYDQLDWFLTHSSSVA